MANFDINEFNEKSWKKHTSLELKRYISYAVKEINKRNYNDKPAIEAHKKLAEDVTGYTKAGNLSARTMGRTREQLLFEARKLHDFLAWDYSSEEGKFELLNKYKQSYDKYISKSNHAKLTQEQYETYVELVNAFSELSKSYSSDQLREWYDTVESSKYIDLKDLQEILEEYAGDENNSDIIYEEVGGKAKLVQRAIDTLIEKREKAGDIRKYDKI